MRLFLSSQDLGNYADVAAKLAGKNKKALYIKNAQDDLPPEERNFSTPEKKKMFEAAGFIFEEIDLRDYFGKTEKLAKKLSEAGSFWSAGGNVFVLRRAFAASGLDKILLDMLKKDEILYGGWSAGSMIMTPDLKGADWDETDRPDIIPKGYKESKIIWEGLALVPFYIVPHIGNEMFGDRPKGMVNYYETNNLPYYALKDGQVVVVDGDKTEFLK
ncbi:MAG TPA: Type 1 glutamine amidotransferase-like domain-containing protein [Candidatus Saccharimonadales bacterium]|nr:Type 1 glutamine amidotransferase-like domain-containing protein [Candidatus Saccharimonadales bacterium]